jgi:hypothetical protein
MQTSKITRYAIILLVLIFLILSVLSCSTHVSNSSSGKVPPGQAKKMNGDKSAKAYAPGQQKKKK